MYRPWSEEQTNEPIWINLRRLSGATPVTALAVLPPWQDVIGAATWQWEVWFFDGFWQIPGMCGPFCDLASLRQSLKSSGAYMTSIYLDSWDTHSRFTVVQISPKLEKDTQRRSWTCCAMTPDMRSGRIPQNQGRYGGAQAYLQSWLCDPDTSCASTDVI